MREVAKSKILTEREKKLIRVNLVFTEKVSISPSVGYADSSLVRGSQKRRKEFVLHGKRQTAYKTVCLYDICGSPL